MESGCQVTRNKFERPANPRMFVLPQWDINSGEMVQEYDRHLGAVNTITFVDNNTKFVSTSDDKSLRVWEWWVCECGNGQLADVLLDVCSGETAVLADRKWLGGWFFSLIDRICLEIAEKN